MRENNRNYTRTDKRTTVLTISKSEQTLKRTKTYTNSYLPTHNYYTKLSRYYIIYEYPQTRRMTVSSACPDQNSILYITSSMRNNKKITKRLLQIFAHSLNCTMKCNPLCAAFYNMSKHASNHNCEIKTLYDFFYNKLNRHYDQCPSSKCEISQCAEHKAARGLLLLRQSTTRNPPSTYRTVKNPP